MRAIIVTLVAALATTASAAYQSCGSRGQAPCPAGYECIDDPRRDGCGLACDIPGICVAMGGDDSFCGGFAGFECVKPRECYDFPDDCDPENGGADCGGICLLPL